MVGISSRLAKSVLILLLFYGSIFLLSFFSLSPEGYMEWLAKIGRPSEKPIMLLDLNGHLVDEIVGRFRSVIPFLVGGLLVGSASVWAVVFFKLGSYEYRGRKTGAEYRGIGVTIELPPAIEEPKKDNLKFKIPKGVKKEYHALLVDILNYLSHHKDAFVGDGHKGTLLEHTLNVVEKALNHPNADPLLVLAAAAHDMGKTTSHVKVGKDWQRKAFHDRESARILASMDSWWRMDDTERSILTHAIRYEHDKSLLPYQIPGLVTDEVARARALLEQLHIIDGEATKEEKAEVLKDIDVHEAVLGAFLRALPQMPFQIRGMKKGISAGGWRQGDRLYLIEHRARDLSMAQMDADQSAALGGKYREHGQVSAYSRALFEVLDEKGWLIRTAETKPFGGESVIEETVPLDYPLWVIAAGTATFNAIFIVELPESLRHFYPKESQYAITVTDPLRQGKGNGKGNGNGKSAESGRSSGKGKAAPVVEIKPKPVEIKPKRMESKEIDNATLGAAREPVESVVSVVETEKETTAVIKIAPKKPSSDKKPMPKKIAEVKDTGAETSALGRDNPSSKVAEIPAKPAEPPIAAKAESKPLPDAGGIDFADDDALF